MKIESIIDSGLYKIVTKDKAFVDYTNIVWDKKLPNTYTISCDLDEVIYLLKAEKFFTAMSNIKRNSWQLKVNVV